MHKLSWKARGRLFEKQRSMIYIASSFVNKEAVRALASHHK
jgi:hypothetical protein